MENATDYLNAPYRIDSLYRAGSNDTLFLLLHGYGQSAQSFYDLIQDTLPKDSSILAPNGPFPLPGKVRTAASLGYAWYFYDSLSDEFFVPYSLPANLLRDLFHQRKLKPKKLIIIGYSQGGYLAPFAAEVLENVQHVVCLNASFRYELMNDKKFPVHAINGACDEMVDPKQAQQRHQQLAPLGRQGDFHLLPDSNHRIDTAMKEKLALYLD